MSRLTMLALAAALAFGSFVTVSDAWARPGGHVSRSPGGSVRSFSVGPRFSAPRLSPGPRFSAAPRLSRGPRLSAAPRLSAGPRFGVYRGYPRRYGVYRGYRYLPYGHYGYSSCYRWRQVWTPYGFQYVRVNVCYPYARYPFAY